jgi:hypothetical protein
MSGDSFVTDVPGHSTEFADATSVAGSRHKARPRSSLTLRHLRVSLSAVPLCSSSTGTVRYAKFASAGDRSLDDQADRKARGGRDRPPSASLTRRQSARSSRRFVTLCGFVERQHVGRVPAPDRELVVGFTVFPIMSRRTCKTHLYRSIATAELLRSCQPEGLHDEVLIVRLPSALAMLAEHKTCRESPPTVLPPFIENSCLARMYGARPTRVRGC